MRRAADGVSIGTAARAHIYRIWLTEESKKSCEHVTQRGRRSHQREGAYARTLAQTSTAQDPHGGKECSMSPHKRDAKQHAKARRRRYRTAQERLAHD